MAAVDLRASKTGYLTLDQRISSDTPTSTGRRTAAARAERNQEFHGAVTHWLFRTGGYVDSCYHATARECGLTADECVLLARNSLEATFATPEDKAALVARLRAYCEGFSA